MSYQGWKNWETWNIVLWYGNEEPLYRSVVREYKHSGRFTAKSAKEFVMDAMPDGTPDMRDLSPTKLHDAFAKVSWTEVARDFNETGKG